MSKTIEIDPRSAWNGRLLGPFWVVKCLFISNSTVNSLYLGLLLGATGCVSGPKHKEMTLLESFNGKNYETPVVPENGASTTPLSVPLVQRRRASVVIQGRLFLVDSQIPMPLSNQEILLIRGSEVLSRARSDAGGDFSFVGDFPDGRAKIQLDSKHYSGESLVEIRGFEIRDLELSVKRNSSK